MRRFATVVVLSLVCTPGCEDHDSSDSTLAIIEPDCTLEGDLIVELGEGAEVFEPIPPGDRPTLHYGSQGGTHLVLAARLITPDPLDRYQLTLLAEAGQEPCIGERCSSFSPIGRFEGIVEGSARIRQLDADQLEITSLFLLVDNWLAAPVQRLTIEVTDACERKTVAMRGFASAP